MNPFRILASSVMAVCLAVLVCSVACQTAAPPSQTTPPPTASAHKLGVNVNYANSIGNLVVETGVVEWPQATSTADAALAIAESPMGLVGPGPDQIPITTCYYHTQSALTASQSNYATISVYKRNALLGDGATTQTLIAQTNTVTNAADAGLDAAAGATGSWSAFQNVVIPALAGAYISPGDAVTFAMTKTGTGVVVPIGQVACFTSIN